jgi:hypothetical protein
MFMMRMVASKTYENDISKPPQRREWGRRGVDATFPKQKQHKKEQHEKRNDRSPSRKP